jgi:LacI family transcriptional regulator
VMLWPPLTTVHQPVRDLASEALRLLVAEMAATERPPARRPDRVLEHTIVKRESTAVVRPHDRASAPAAAE